MSERRVPVLQRSAFVLAYLRADDFSRPQHHIAAYAATNAEYPAPREKGSVLAYAAEIMAIVGLSSPSDEDLLRYCREGTKLLDTWYTELYPPEPAIQAAQDFSRAGSTSGPA